MMSRPPDDSRAGSAMIGALAAITAAALLLLLLIAMVRPVLVQLSGQITRSEALVEERSEALR